MENRKKLIVVAGPTAVGKTAVALALAKHFQTEIVSADSRQIFRELHLGTAKPSADELGQVRHHFIDSHSIHEDYDAAQYGHDALALIHELFTQHNEVILCGGSGLYVKAVCEGFDDIPEIDPAVREKLTAEFQEHGIAVLQEKMQTLDAELYATIDRQNPQRLMRALEVRIGTGQSIAFFRKQNKRTHNFTIIKTGLTLPREELYGRIDTRMDQMIADGLFAEAESLFPLRALNALQTVGYQEIFDFMEGKYNREEAIRLLKRNSRHYAKRQLTWFTRDPGVQWFSPGEVEKIIEVVKNA
ncbi:tRNA (adenosine(37)-N6)-dimethylallyltransferase MiaA [Chryseolinea lacunae]|uniref:tRNA dimethylallyltransferase n=1 Tax=Chryseolinea lacunae TaxID=2801331 RepID=A0ABS1KQ52_9BACT|nr:tRNA (adenosine(37)-N6)-dimethylallyltransferase MiaA [Chryseolinea lacunae]MBL0741342.1 tRNA (adenosine(37)-N6)-dimethylallyltransferase MiaA [Chryseolinea lacunae]